MTLDRSCYVIADPMYVVTATFISTMDNGESVYCDCRIVDGVPDSEQRTPGVGCVISMYRCPLQQTLDLTIS